MVITQHFRAMGYRVGLAIDSPKFFVDPAIALEREMFATGVAARNRKPLAGRYYGVGVVSEFAVTADWRYRDTEVRAAWVLAEIDLNAAKRLWHPWEAKGFVVWRSLGRILGHVSKTESRNQADSRLAPRWFQHKLLTA